MEGSSGMLCDTCFRENNSFLCDFLRDSCEKDLL